MEKFILDLLAFRHPAINPIGQRWDFLYRCAVEKSPDQLGEWLLSNIVVYNIVDLGSIAEDQFREENCVVVSQHHVGTNSFRDPC